MAEGERFVGEKKCAHEVNDLEVIGKYGFRPNAVDIHCRKCKTYLGVYIKVSD